MIRPMARGWLTPLRIVARALNMPCNPLRFVLLATAGLATPALAQEATDGAQDTVIVVTGRGLEETPAAPAYGTVEITREEVLGTPSGRIEEALAGVAGFQQFRRSDSRSSNPTAQGVTLRALGGNATSRALVTLDGVPVRTRSSATSPSPRCCPNRSGGSR